MADRPVQPGRTWRAGERNAQTQQSSSSLSPGRPRRLGEHSTRALASTISFRTTLSGPDAMRAATLPHSHACLCLCSATDTRLVQSSPGQQKDRAGQPLSRRPIPCPSQHFVLFRLRPVDADNAWVSASQKPIQSQSPPRPLGTDRDHGDNHAPGRELRLLIRTSQGAVQLSLLGQL